MIFLLHILHILYLKYVYLFEKQMESRFLTMKETKIDKNLLNYKQIYQYLI